MVKKHVHFRRSVRDADPADQAELYDVEFNLGVDDFSQFGAQRFDQVRVCIVDFPADGIDGGVEFILVHFTACSAWTT